MEYINKSKLKEVIGNLNNNQKIFMKINEDDCNILKYYNLKLSSYESLFNTCIIDNHDVTNSSNLNKFLEEYTKAYIQQYEILQQIVINTVGKENYEYIKLNNVYWVVDQDINIISFQKNNIKCKRYCN